MKPENHPALWTFACALYEIDEVKIRCLELQNQYSANVDIILWLCWQDVFNIQVDSGALVDALKLVGGVSQEFLDRLRSARGQLKKTDVNDDTKKRIHTSLIDAELAFEKVLLQRLQDFTDQLSLIPVAATATRLTLFQYLRSLSLADANIDCELFLARSRLCALENTEHGFALHQL